MCKKTKILATVSDLKCDVGFLKELIEKGVNGFRLNTAHQDLEDSLKVIESIRKSSKIVPIVIDTKGPEIRISRDSLEVEVKEGEEINLGYGLFEKGISVNYKNFVSEVPVGSKILVDDGALSFEVLGKEKEALRCVAENSGKVKKRKSVNVPGVSLNIASLSEKDRRYVEFAAKNDIDFIAHSFVRNKEDLLVIQKILDKYDSKTKIISKIENQEGIDNVDEILDYSYGVMIARGDLGVEVPFERIPLIQTGLIKKCVGRKKLAIVATQMLHSMIENPRPTRAEIIDIANAVLGGADCLMLSGETANGDYPLEAVETMTKIAIEIENEKNGFGKIEVENIKNEISAYLAKSAVRASVTLPVRAIISDTLTGRTARYIAAFRSRCPVYVQCYSEKVMRQLSLSYGILPSYIQKKIDLHEFFSKTMKILLKNANLNEKDLVVVIAGSFGPNHGASFMEISEIGNLMQKS